MTKTKRTNDHKCPRPGCNKRVPNSKFACREDWFALSRPVRDAIWATKDLTVLVPERRGAFQAAQEEWNG